MHIETNFPVVETIVETTVETTVEITVEITGKKLEEYDFKTLGNFKSVFRLPAS